MPPHDADIFRFRRACADYFFVSIPNAAMMPFCYALLMLLPRLAAMLLICATPMPCCSAHSAADIIAAAADYFRCHALCRCHAFAILLPADADAIAVAAAA